MHHSRGAMLSLRVTRAERKRLLELKQERECRNLSEVLRLLLGFPRYALEDDGLEGWDDVESVDRLCHLVLSLRDRQDQHTRILNRIARHLGVPYEKSELAVLQAPLGELVRRENGVKHPPLPEGFSR
jgi:hypothetical protein